MGFVLAWTWLNAVANVRFPGEERRLWFVPCIDTVVLLGAFALVRWRGRSLPRAVFVALAAFFVVVRFFRTADGISERAFDTRFDLSCNLLLIAELPRLLRTTLSPWQIWGLGFGVLALLGFVGVSAYAALRVTENSLISPRIRNLFIVASLAFAIFSLLPESWREGVRPPPPSAVLRLVRETESMIEASGARERERRSVDGARDVFSHLPANLARLRGHDVLLFIFESYGETVFEDAAYAPKVLEEYAAFERELGAQGYAIASSTLDSPTFGGRSWFAHTALETGLRVQDQSSFEALWSARPLTIADVFRAAGYHTVLARPATQRTESRDVLRFDTEYDAKDFAYRGPELGWGKMPDQFVIDFVHRRELARHARPVFVEYALVTSHVPWLAEPSVLDDWSRIGDGSVFSTLPIERHAAEWTNVDQASDAYRDAVLYDLEVLRRYLASELHNDTLVIIVGDHQPPGGVTRSSTGHGVPIHVLSRDAALVAPFRRRGYVPGMRPAENTARERMESFLFEFIRDFSTDLRQTSLVPTP